MEHSMGDVTVEDVSEVLKRVMAASALFQETRVVALATHDHDAAVRIVRATAVAAQRSVHQFSATRRRVWRHEKREWEDAGGGGETADLLTHARELRGGAVVIVEDAEQAFRDEHGDARARDILRAMCASDARHAGGLVLVFPTHGTLTERLPGMLADRFVRVALPYPQQGDLEVIVREEIAKVWVATNAPMDVERIRAKSHGLALELVGLTESAARDAMRDAIAASPEDLDAARVFLRERRAMLLARELSMRVLDGTTDAEIPIGIGAVFDHVVCDRSRAIRHGRDRARGILLLGPPGTGKTMLARSVGSILGLPVVEFRVSALMSSLLGDTERRFAQAFSTLAALAPCVVWIDEIEKAFGDSSERDGGTMMRVTGALLTWLSDNEHPNYVVATTNNLRRMGELGLTLSRAGRFDEIFFLDVPTVERRVEMLARWMHGIVPDAEHGRIAVACAERTEHFSGADLAALVQRARASAEADGAMVTEARLIAEIERRRPRAHAVHDEFQDLRRWACAYCEPADRPEKPMVVATKPEGSMR